VNIPTTGAAFLGAILGLVTVQEKGKRSGYRSDFGSDSEEAAVKVLRA
jgi:hypothetical protein